MSQDNPINLNLPTTGIETKFPSLNIGEYKCSLAKVEGVESKNTPGLYMLKITHLLQEPATSDDGRPIQPGFEFIGNITLPLASNHANYKEESDHPTTGIRMRSVCAFLDAAFGTDKDTRPQLTNDLLPQFAGKVVKVKIKARKEASDEYGSTQVGGYAKAQG